LPDADEAGQGGGSVKSEPYVAEIVASFEPDFGTLFSIRNFPRMARYVFNLLDGRSNPDMQGEELPSNEAAWRAATLIAGELFKDIDGNLDQARNGH